jgi:3-hydroxymyristoyl/3-hydroxydecanoyl-(acyl carrier protein) dehydratase
LLWHIGTVKYHRAVRPGEALQLEYELQPDGRARFELRTADALVASGTIERRAAASLVAVSVP